MNPLYVKLYSKHPSSEALLDIMRTFYSFHAIKDYAGIDKILGEINRNRLDDVIIISLLRCNYPIKKHLSNYDSFLSMAKQKYAGTDKEKILRGLELKEK